jgi:hypothetical protein
MSLIVEIEEVEGSNTWVEMRSRLTNSPGTPVSAAVANDTGQAIAGTFTLQFSSVIAGTSATVKVLTSSPDNPYRDLAGRTVNLNNTTVYRDIIGGIDLKFSSSGSFANTWEAEIRIGHDFGAVAAFGATAGQPTDSRKIRVRNDDEAEAARNVRAVIASHVKMFPTAGVVFAAVFDFAPGATEKITDGQVQPYQVTVENKTGSGAGITADIKVDGDLVNVRNKTTNDEGTSEDMNVVDVYEIIDGDLEGVEFQLSQSILNTATANFLIFDSRFTQTAPDVGGAPGDWGTVEVLITSDGEDEGTIAPDGFGFFHVRLLAPDGSISKSNPYICDVQVIGETASAAGWNS